MDLKPCVEPLYSWFGLFVIQHISYLFNARKNMDDMNNILTLLETKKSDVEKVLEDAKTKNDQPVEEVNHWLEEVAKLEGEVQAVRADYAQIGHHHPLHNFILPSSWLSIHSCSSKAANIKDEAAELMQERACIIDLTAPIGPDCIQVIAGSSSHVGKAIEQNLKSVLDYLQDERVGVVGIWGPGGVGKTTLLSRINNSLKGDRNLKFDCVIWVMALQPLQLEKLRKDIAERLELSSSSPSLIFNFLKNKNFLLLLDDLWEDFNLNDVGIPQPLCNSDKSQRKQKVVLTTRNAGVCSRMQVDKEIKVECLEPEEALQLFREAARGIMNSDPKLETLGKEVAKECHGLPIALLTIGKAMSNQKTVHQWKDALRKLHSHTGDIRGMDRIYSSLRISYDNLEDDTHKECFLYCSLWPEDYNIDKEELIRYWLADGLIDLGKFENNSEAAFNHGHAIIENLKDACLLEDSGRDAKAVKMHAITRDLAVWIGGKSSKWRVKVVTQRQANS